MCVCACVRACMRACVRVCVRVFVGMHVCGICVGKYCAALGMSIDPQSGKLLITY